VGLLLVSAGSILLVYLLGKRLFSIAAGCAAGAAYALLSVGSSVMGTQAHATHFLILPALAGTLLLVRFQDSGRSSLIYSGGFLFGLAFVMKQQGAPLAVFGMACVAALQWNRERGHWRALVRQLALFVAAAALPFGLTCLVLWRAGVFPRFWFWTFTYARAYATESSFSDGLEHFTSAFLPIFQQNSAIWIASAIGLVLIWRKRENRESAAFVTALLVFSFLAVCPGLYFRAHYFVLVLPAVALLAGACVGLASTAFHSQLPYWAFAAALIWSAAGQREFLFHMSPLEISRDLYGRNPFPEALPVAAYIRAHSARAARIAVLGSEPEIYFYADRHSATSYIYTYSLMEVQSYALRMQNEMIREVEAAAPEYVVRVIVDQSWLRSPESPTRIFDWWAQYGPRHYRLVGVADILTEDHTEYVWDSAAESYRPQSDCYLEVYRKRDTAARATTYSGAD
jgi:Dolichyl-phosphate-mannose-protein mannosyltransferase